MTYSPFRRRSGKSPSLSSPDTPASLCFRGCWVAERVGVDRSAGDGMLSCSRLKLRKSRIVPSGCLIQVTANTQQV
ncbi:hypothetical protein FQN60_000784 [Etheostoma spectabile]|uniref:Uncharacterized protein n=1 Tax=Etheostoma spectabile TaxID=54343 RepID=A0A5J5CWX9_9PERO|nr:hypothetical protein FQN60_000784 [Etheostoma spectabile]